MGTAIMMAAATAGGTQSSLAMIDVPQSGNIIGVEWSNWGALDTTADYMEAQLSFGSTFTSSNDSRQIISHSNMGQMTALTAVGASMGQDHVFVPLPSIPVNAGERLFLHSNGSATTVCNLRAVIHFDFDLDKLPARRR